ncbi:MAG: putative futalosine nucleosidase [Candidatus Desulfovibrio kirbyi]|uniref:Futalosine hydrolase n=1 Tax=Candidatus Desulfovibrio kirbyi TaxID=2696086 RepID=A0A6L2R4G6_9BACT|nr:MAG: putative futalosine nucleosidase [Candidatus Desulfovibrio kirbyi]
MTLLICASTQQELAALFPACAMPVSLSAQDNSLAVHRYRLKNWEVFFCVTGVGPINAALALGYCIAGAKARNQPIDAVLNVGLAGAFDLHALPLRTLCCVREEIWPEYGLHDGQSVTAGAFGFPLWERPDGMQVRDRLPLADLDACDAFGIPKPSDIFVECRSLTVAGVSASFARAQTLRSAYRADIENMEGFAVAYACARDNIPCMEIRSVSNKVGARAKDEKDFDGALQALARVLPEFTFL